MKNINTMKCYTIVPWIKRSETNSTYAKFIHTSTSFPALHPWFITGFVDGEGCFSIDIPKNNKMKAGWAVQPVFNIGLHSKDKALLEQIQSYFGAAGNISRHGSEGIQFLVKSGKALKEIIDHFEKYPLITQKHADFLLFKQAVELIEQKEHLTSEGLAKIVAIKASMNRGLSEKLKTAFPPKGDILPVPRPLVENQEIPDPNWFAGFTSGEGCFFIDIFNSASTQIGFQIKLVFKLTQHSRDEELMKSLVEYLDCGNVTVKSNKLACDFQSTKFTDLIEKIIPFFIKYPIFGVKSKDFEDWCKVAELMQNKVHLTASGLDQIRKIKAGMNRGRN